MYVGDSIWKERKKRASGHKARFTQLLFGPLEMFEEIIVMAASPSPKAQKHIAERVSKKQCLCCDKPLLKRGLCYQCYYKWRTARQALSSMTKRAAYDAKLIRIGKLLAAQDIRQFKDSSVFSQASKEVG